MSPNSAKTYKAALRAVLARYEDDAPLPKDWRGILKGRGERPARVWLDKSELERLEKVTAFNKTELTTKLCFLIGAYTGMRHSDIIKTKAAAVQGGRLVYVSKKTGVTAAVPCAEKTRGWIERMETLNPAAVPLERYNNAIRELCQRAGIDAPAAVHRAGEDAAGPKWRFVTSHTARVSFCTNLANMGVPILEISRMAGHTSTSMTERYIAGGGATPGPEAMRYFGIPCE